MNKVVIPVEYMKDLACKECASTSLVQLVTLRYYKGVLTSNQLVTAVTPIFRCADCGKPVEIPSDRLTVEPNE